MIRRRALNLADAERLDRWYPEGKSVYLKHNTLVRLSKYFTDEKSIDVMVNKLLDVVTPKKGEFIWALDVEKYNLNKT